MTMKMILRLRAPVSGRELPRFRIGFVLLHSLALVATTAAVAAPDFASAEKESLATLRQLVAVDTMNPPGNETRGDELVQAILQRDGIASETLSLEPGRGNIVARLKGSGRKKPVLLMAHMDTVGVERDKWTVDPFASVERDGHLFGRGASDDKSMVAIFLEVLLLLKREHVQLDRDVIFLAEADEESSGRLGIRFLVDKHWDKIECEFALNEGGTIDEDESGRVKYVGISTAEKIPRNLFLAATGVSAHASRPRPDNPITHLAAAVAKVGQWQAPMRLNETTRIFFERLAKVSPPDEAQRYTHLEDPAVQDYFRRTNFFFNSMLRTTISPTVLKAGFRFNVVPADALATLDMRA